MPIVQKLGSFFILGFFLLFTGVSHGGDYKNFELISVGIRAGANLDYVRIPPGEKENFRVYDVLGILAFPGSWDTLWDWEARYLWYASAGVIRAAGDTGLISTFGPGLGFTKKEWNLSLEMGTGAVFVSDEKFGEQDFGGPVQILGHGGISYHFPAHVTVGWRFQHFSDATIYGKDNRGVDLHFLELSYRF